jgi:hypothetical protein
LRFPAPAKALLLASVTLLAASEARDAAACGGCFIQQSESTQVTGHQMVLSISQQRTTLWDQIKYSGSPSSFAWVLPIHGVADIGTSSDALFQALDQNTQVTIASPTIDCTQSSCGAQFAAGGGEDYGGGGAGGGGGGGVTVLAQEVVGPYETVQLQSTDPEALQKWLSEKGYAIPADIQPVINQYVTEGFNFLAMKLVPGKGVNAMVPIRITTAGASPVLPLRMVAAGTGAITPITLWVMGEGRWQTKNLPSFVIDGAELFWNWDTQSSNYAALKQIKFASTQNKGWLVEAAEPISQYGFDWLIDQTMWNPESTGYGEDETTAFLGVTEDLDALYGSIDPSSLWVTRLHGELSRPALAADLTLEASPDQSTVERYFDVELTVGTAPECPPSPPCQQTGFWDVNSPRGSGASCAMNQGSAPALGVLALAATLALTRRRRARRP